MHTIKGLIAGLTLMSAAALASALATERPVLPVQLVPMPPEPIETLLHDLDGDGALDGVVLYIHGMYTSDVEAVRHDVLRLEELALRAFGTPSDYERVHREVIEHEALIAPHTSHDERGDDG